jgi:membrane protease YdiL (CAAX protease family)
VSQSLSPKAAGWLMSIVLFGVPAQIFFWLFHWVGPQLLEQGASWLVIFHCLLVAPLGCMLLAPFVCLRIQYGSPEWRSWTVRLRLTRPRSSAWFWAAALSGFMYGGNWQDAVALMSAWIALWKEQTKERWVFAAVPAFIVLKRNLSFIVPAAASVRFFDSVFNREFFSHFGPTDFMGIPLAGAWWVVLYYIVWLVILNIFGEEPWWRGYVLPRQEVLFGRATWIVHGIFWSAFHLFIQPTLFDTVRMAVTGTALSFVAHRTKNTWPGIIGHSFANMPLLLSIVRGVAIARS